MQKTTPSISDSVSPLAKRTCLFLGINLRISGTGLAQDERSSAGVLGTVFSETMMGRAQTVEIWALRSMPEAELPTMMTFCDECE